MHLTDHELTAASSAVAALAIIGGYLGVRSANHNALAIAREESSTRRKDELDALKRATYAKLLAALTVLSTSSMEREGANHNATATPAYRVSTLRQWLAAMHAGMAALAEVELIAPDLVRELAQRAFAASRASTQTDANSFTRTLGVVGVAMRYDLRGTKMPSLEVMERIGHQVMANAPKPPSSSPPKIGQTGR